MLTFFCRIGSLVYTALKFKMSQGIYTYVMDYGSRYLVVYLSKTNKIGNLLNIEFRFRNYI